MDESIFENLNENSSINSILNVSEKEYGKNLSGIDFSGLKIYDADFSDYDLSGASFKNTILSNVNFQRASLKGVDFGGASITDCNFLKSTMKQTSFENCSAILNDGIEKTRAMQGDGKDTKPILFVEDQEDTIIGNLQRLRYSVPNLDFVVVKKVKDAIEYLQHKPFKIAIIDCQIPRYEGDSPQTYHGMNLLNNICTGEVLLKSKNMKYGALTHYKSAFREERLKKDSRFLGQHNKGTTTSMHLNRLLIDHLNVDNS